MQIFIPGPKVPVRKKNLMKRVLFLCTGNSCRSQMAEGWARQMFGDGMDLYSAGTAPHGVDPLAVKVMAEAGVDISSHTPNDVKEYLNIPFDLVITVCDSARESCPVFSGGAKTMHRSFEDPPSLAQEVNHEGEILASYRQVRDEIRDFIHEIKKSL
jgi:arsenate reductase